MVAGHGLACSSNGRLRSATSSRNGSQTNSCMTGNNGRGIVLQARDWQLLQELAVMRVVDREQAKIVAGFGSTTRANVRLLALTRAGLLRRFFLGSRKSL